ncbi:MAG: MFS transporter [Planctomycetia bacterium]|jgi:MFS family permease
MPTVPIPPRGSLRRDLWVTTADAAAYSVMVGCGETYIPAFALALGFGPVAAGFTVTIPLLIGAVVQLVTPMAVARLGSNRAWVIGCTTLQAASFLPLIAWAFGGRAEFWELLVAASVYWSAGMAGVPAWNSWMGTLIPERMRAGYFAQRTRLGQFSVCIGFVIGGVLLQTGKARDMTLVAFAVLFAAAAVARLLSTACLVVCREPKPPEPHAREAGPAGERRRGLVQTLRTMVGQPSGRIVAFLCCFVFGVQFASPYYGPYMLEEMQFSYRAFMVVVATQFLARALALPMLGRIASRIGSLRLLGLAAFAVVPMGLLWIPSADVAYLVVVQSLAGCCWAAYELAVALVFFDHVPTRERTGVITVYNLGIAIATVAGGTCGGLTLWSLGTDRRAYIVVFLVSCLLRLAALPLLGRRAASARP